MHELKYQEPVEGAFVAFPYAITNLFSYRLIYPRTMVVVTGHTPLTIFTMLRSQNLILIAFGAISAFDVGFILQSDVNLMVSRRTWLFHNIDFNCGLVGLFRAGFTLMSCGLRFGLDVLGHGHFAIEFVLVLSGVV